MPRRRQVPTLAKAIGANLRRIRHAEGLRQEDVAQQVRALGLAWSRSVIAAIESGGRTLDVGELALLAVAVQRPFMELLAGTGEVEVAPEVRVELGQLRANLMKPTAGDVTRATIVKNQDLSRYIL